MQRLLPIVLVLGLLVASAAAFAVTESLKLVKSPITSVEPFHTFSPVCRCRTDSEPILFSLRAADRVTLTILGSSRSTIVRTLAVDHAAHAGPNRFSWNGRNDDGSVAADGTYYTQVALALARKTITIPNRISLDTTPPKVVSAKVNRVAFSPDRDGQADAVRISARFSESAHLAVYLAGSRILFTRLALRDNTTTWGGSANFTQLPPRVYRLEVGGVDVAGNPTPAAGRKLVIVRIRYIEPANAVYTVPAGARFLVRVDTDARAFAWRLGRRKGVAHDKHLVIRAPAKAGRYRLVLREHGHTGAATVIAEPRR